MAIILNINNLSAKVLGDVIHLSTSKIKFYVVIDISGGYRDVKEETPLAREEGVTNHPTWNYDMSFFVSGNECLYLKLYGKRPLKMDKFVGEVLVPMQVIMRNNDNSVGTAVTYPLYRKSKLRGEISFAYKFIRNMDQDQAAGPHELSVVMSSVTASADLLNDHSQPTPSAANPQISLGNPPAATKKSKVLYGKIAAGLGVIGANVAGTLASDAIIDLIDKDVKKAPEA